MQKQKLRLLAVSIASLTIIAGIAAYFSSSDMVTNSFEASALRIRIQEPSWHDNPTIVPDQQVDKDPYILNTDETPAYVFLLVTVPAQEVSVEDDQPDADKGKLLGDEPQNVPLFRFINSSGEYTADPFSTEQCYNGGWYFMEMTPVTDDSGTVRDYTYLYAYTGDNQGNTMAVLNPGERTATPLFNKVLFCNAREDDTLPGSRQTIGIEALGIQTEHLRSSGQTETEAEIIWQYLKK